ncbi:MAG: EF-hand domain-containing protein [Winogradskyella sp.]|nr:EF-hand domain-containing protein [Winogradskyella sp.]
MYRKIGILVIGLALLTACSTTQNQRTEQSQRNQSRDVPSADQLIAKMDANKDGKLSKSEIKGPLANDFSKVDTNNDGYISKEELEKAPKPLRGGRPQGR